MADEPKSGQVDFGGYSDLEWLLSGLTDEHRVSEYIDGMKVVRWMEWWQVEGWWTNKLCGWMEDRRTDWWIDAGLLTGLINCLVVKRKNGLPSEKTNGI